MEHVPTFITVNGRKVSIKHILERDAVAHDSFEDHTFAFIRRWFSTDNTFTLQTSGSTGTPKKITVTRDQMIASATMTQEALGLRKGFRALVCLDTRYVAGQMMLVRCFVTQMEIYATTPVANPLQNHPDFDFVALVPYQVTAVLASSPHTFPATAICIVGGAPLDPATIKALQPLSTTFYATYGMTETLSHIALRKLNGKDVSTNFNVLPGIKIEADSRQCLVIDAPYLTEQIITNDIVEILDQDTFRWLGRYDHVINSGGVKIMPEEVEDVVGDFFSELHYPERYFIAGEPDERLGEKVVLFVEGHIFSNEDQKTLSEKLRKSLPAYAIPKEVIVLDTFETTQTGKINRLRSVQNIDKTLQKFTLKK
ncbi:AMP-binding protein [Pseudochryseolinea flava]|nr:AMP-binding protein [Pseudochryseolinea flava]